MTFSDMIVISIKKKLIILMWAVMEEMRLAHASVYHYFNMLCGRDQTNDSEEVKQLLCMAK